MRKKLRQLFFPLTALLIAFLLCSCGKQAERDNQLLRAENQSLKAASQRVQEEIEGLKADNQRLQGEIDSLKALARSTPKTEKVTVVPLDVQPVHSPAAIQTPQTNPNAPQQKYWLTTSTHKRHNSSCRYFGNSKGRSCGPNEGTPCKLCGG